MNCLFRRNRAIWLLSLLLVSPILAACGSSPTPIAVYVTPTPLPTETPLKQAQELKMVVLPVERYPSQTAVAYLVATARPTATPGTYGSIVGSNVAAVAQQTTPQPTPSPRATRTPADPNAPTATPLPTLDADLMGIQINTDLSEEDYTLAMWYTDKLGMQWVKFQFDWSILEPEQNMLSDALYRYRLFVQRAKQNGYNVLVSIAKAPDWARSSLDEDGPPRDPQMLASFITRLLGEIRVDLYGKSYIDAIEVWNEPNLRREWNGGSLNGADYMRYFDAAYQAIRAAEGGTGITVVTAGLATTGVNDNTAADDRAYLRQMVQAGLGGYENIAIGIHPYGAWNSPDARCCQDSEQGYDTHPSFFFLDNIEDYHDIMLESGDTSRQLWATEFGWGTYDGLLLSDGQAAIAPPGEPYFNYITARQQADYIIRAFEIGQSLPYMGLMILWNLNFAGTAYVEQQDPRSAYAILGNMEDPRRSAFRRLARVPKTSDEDE